MDNLKDILKKTLKQVAAQENIQEYDEDIKELSTEGANYTSAIFSAKIISQNRSGLDLFAKVACISEKMRNQMKTDVMFSTERFVYHDLAKIYNDIQEKFKVPEHERFKFPKFYASNDAEMEETIILENLVSQGYTMYDRFKPLSWEFAAKAVEELAKFHALSFAYQKYNPEEFPKDDSKFNFTLTVDTNVMKMAFDHMAGAAYPVVNETVRKRLQNFVEKLWTDEIFKKYYGPVKRSVLTHGDYRASNILFKRQAGRIKNLVPVDYQTVRLASPSTDLIYLIYSGTDEEFRRLHLKHLLDHYYETLSRFLIMFDMDPEAVFSRDDFDEDFVDNLGYGLSIAIFLLPIVMVDPSNAPKMSDQAADLSSFAVSGTEAFKKRFLPIVNEFIDLGLL